MDHLEIRTRPADDEPDVELVEIVGDPAAFQWLISAAGNARDGFRASSDEQGVGPHSRLRRRLVLEPLTPNEKELEQRVRSSVHKLHERAIAGNGPRRTVTLTTRAVQDLGGPDRLHDLFGDADIRIEDPALEQVGAATGEPRVGVAGEPPRELEWQTHPIGDLEISELVAVLTNDTSAGFPAGQYEVPAAIGELGRRAAAGEELALQAVHDLPEHARPAVEKAIADHAAGEGDGYEGRPGS